MSAQGQPAADIAQQRPFSTWSLAKLRDYLIGAKIVSAVSRETLRTILHEGGVSWQATKTWKSSNDPDFQANSPASWTYTTIHPPMGG